VGSGDLTRRPHFGTMSTLGREPVRRCTRFAAHRPVLRFPFRHGIQPPAPKPADHWEFSRGRSAACGRWSGSRSLVPAGPWPSFCVRSRVLAPLTTTDQAGSLYRRVNYLFTAVGVKPFEGGPLACTTPASPFAAPSRRRTGTGDSSCQPTTRAILDGNALFPSIFSRHAGFLLSGIAGGPVEPAAARHVPLFFSTPLFSSIRRCFLGKPEPLASKATTCYTWRVGPRPGARARRPGREAGPTQPTFTTYWQLALNFWASALWSQNNPRRLRLLATAFFPSLNH